MIHTIFVSYLILRDSLDDTQCESLLEFPSSPFVGPSQFSPADFFALHPDCTFLSSSSSLPSSSLFQHGIFFDPYGIPSQNTNSASFQPSHESYRYRRDSPLRLPVRFVVPPRNDDVWSDPMRTLCFEDISACDSKNTYANNGHSRNRCIDNYSRIISENVVSRRLDSEYFQSTLLSNSSRRIFNASHQSPATANECRCVISERKLRKCSSVNDDNVCNIDDRSNGLQNSDNKDRRSRSKSVFVQQRNADETSTKTRRNMQQFLADRVKSAAHDQHRHERRESESVASSDSGSNPPKMKITSPLDLTKLK